jgi:hypothetical protein
MEIPVNIHGFIVLIMSLTSFWGPYKDYQSQSPENAQELTSYLAFQALHFAW